MAVTVIKEYDVHLDTKHRLTLRGAATEYYSVKMLANGHVILEPRLLVHPRDVSAKTLRMMDKAVENFKQGRASPVINLKKYLKKALRA
jgi:hypothetical protein